MRTPVFAVLLLLTASCAAVPTAAPPTPPSRLAAIPAEAVRRTPATDRYPPVLQVAGWSDPVPLPGPINTAGAEDSPFLTPDGRSLFFFFTPDLNAPPEQQLTDGVTGIYRSTLGPDGWGEPQRLVLQAPGELALDGCPTTLDDTLWFCTARPGNLRDIDLWTAVVRDGVWQDWHNAGPLINATYTVGEMHLSLDGTTMLFHRPRGEDLDLDLYVTERTAGGWSEPRSLAALNTAADEGWPYLSPDGLELWFTRFVDGSPAIFRSQRLGADWSPPERIVSPFAGEPTLDPAGNLIFVHHFVEDGRLIEADLYIAYRRAP